MVINKRKFGAYILVIYGSTSLRTCIKKTTKNLKYRTFVTCRNNKNITNILLIVLYAFN